MESFYWMFGDWDGFVVYDVPDVATAAAFSGRVTSSGLIEKIKTQQLLTMEEAREGLEKAGKAEAAYEPPGTQTEWRAEYDALG